MAHRDRHGDHRAPVAALGRVPLVAEPGHQLVPRVGDPRYVPSPRRRFVAPAVPGERRAHDVEGVGRIAAVGTRVAERLDDLDELDDRARPAVGQHERERVGLGGAGVHDMDPETADVGAELRQIIEARLGRTPVVVVGPVAAQVLDERKRDPLRPVRCPTVADGLALGPARAAQPGSEVVEVGVRDGEAERGQLHPAHPDTDGPGGPSVRTPRGSSMRDRPTSGWSRSPVRSFTAA